MDNSPKPPPRSGTESRSLIFVALIIVVALAIYLFLPGGESTTDQVESGPGEEWSAEPAPVPQIPPEEESAQEPAP